MSVFHKFLLERYARQQAQAQKQSARDAEEEAHAEHRRRIERRTQEQEERIQHVLGALRKERPITHPSMYQPRRALDARKAGKLIADWMRGKHR